MKARADWPSVFIAAMAGAAAMSMFQLAVAPAVTGESPWTLIRNTAAIGVGPLAFARGGAGIILAFALSLHVSLSLAYAVPIEPALRRMEHAPAILAGAAYGCALYFLNYHGLSFLFPWFAFARGGAALASHMVYGAALGTIYPLLRRARESESETEETP